MNVPYCAILGLVNDAFALAKVGLLPYGTALDLTLYLGKKLYIIT